MPTLLVHMAAGIMATLAILHLIYTLHDAFVRPKYFVPADRSLLEKLKKTTTALSPSGRNLWQNLIGFHLSHAIGVLLYAYLIEVAMAPNMKGLRAGLIGIGMVYAVIGWTCWFQVPAWGATISVLLLTAGWLLPG